MNRLVQIYVEAGYKSEEIKELAAIHEKIGNRRAELDSLILSEAKDREDPKYAAHLYQYVDLTTAEDLIFKAIQQLADAEAWDDSTQAEELLKC